MDLSHLLTCLIIGDLDKPPGTTATNKKVLLLKLVTTFQEVLKSMIAMAESAILGFS